MVALQSLLVDCSISTFRILLEGLDSLMVKISQGHDFLRGKTHTHYSSSSAGREKKKVIIVGASFAGLTVQRHLSQHTQKHNVDVTIIDTKTYFEYLPGVLRCFVEPSHFSNISCPLTALRDTNVVTGQVVEVNAAKDGEDTAKNQIRLADGSTLTFDFLVLATGSTYTSPIKAPMATKSRQERQEQWNQSAEDLAKTNIVVIVGAGAVGVELAGEILTSYPKKHVIMIDMASTILPGFRQESIEYASKWLKDHGAQLRLGAPLKELAETYVVFEDGSKLDVDIIYKCTGGVPNTAFLKSGSLAASVKGPKGAVVVNDHLQIDGFPHVFCAGDACFHAKSDELKLGHTAQVNAHLVSENLSRLLQSPDGCGIPDDLLLYPSGVVGNTVTPKIYNLSLGRYDATLAMNSMVISGTFAAIIKWLLEWTQTAAAAQRPIGVLFWFVADEVSNFLGRTVLPTQTSSNPTIKKTQ